jgi:hypothetical protein
MVSVLLVRGSSSMRRSHWERSAVAPAVASFETMIDHHVTVARSTDGLAREDQLAAKITEVVADRREDSTP